MKTTTRYLLLLVVLFAAIGSYAMGVQSGVFVFIIIGFVLEMTFWLKLFPRKKAR